MAKSTGPIVPLIKADLPVLEELEAQFREILANGRITNFGPYVQRFEREAGDYLGAPAVCLSSATAGLIMTLQGLDIPRGCRIAIPSFTFVATAQAVRYAGCEPVFVDICEDGNVDPEDLARVLAAPDVKAAVLVHMYGLPCRTDEIEAVLRDVEQRRGASVPVIYDAAHAFGSARDGVRVGAGGTAEVFSTSVTKVMTSVEGGIVSSRNAPLLARLAKMRNYGIESNYNAHWPGLNGKMSEFHAIVGLSNLAKLEERLATRAAKAEFYAKAIAAKTSFAVMTAPAGTRSTYKDFTIRLPRALKTERDRIMADLAEAGIETRAYFYPPVHEQRFFRRQGSRPLPVTEDVARRVITLPFFTTITEAEMQRVADALAAAETRSLSNASATEGGR